MLFALLGLLGLLVGGCAAAPDLAFRPRSYAFPVATGVTFDLARGRPLGTAELAQRLAPIRLLMLGEHHTDPRSHRFQHDVLSLLVREGRKVTVALEMLPPSANAALGRWRRGELGEAEFLEQSGWYRAWRLAWSHYRDLFLLMRQHRLPVFGVNAEEETKKALRSGRTENLPAALRDEIGDPEQQTLPHTMHLLDALRRGGHGEGLSAESKRFRSLRRVQWMWDRLMGGRAARLAEEAPEGGIVVLLIGSGHLAYKVGANLQAARAGGLPQLSVWDEVLTTSPPGGKHPVPLGIADLARVYPPLAEPAAYPRLAGLTLVKRDQRPERDPATANGPGGVLVKKASRHGRRGGNKSPALREGDVILRLNGQPVTSPAGLRLALERLAFGTTARLDVLRGGGPLTLQIPLRRPAHR
ncbi:MAG: ChaN family lipoprotein [bacterium]